MTRGAALSFYAALSMAPLTLMFVAVTGVIVDESMQQAMVTELQDTVGPQGAAAIDLVMDNVRLEREARGFSVVFSAVMMLLGATAVFVQLQWTMNAIWGVELKSSGIIWVWLKKRLLSLAMMVVLALMLLVSLFITALISGWFPEASTFWNYIDWVLSVVIFTLLFAGMFKLLPDVRVAWRPVWIGASITAVLFAIGKRMIGIYLGTSTFTSAYGAAGSLIALLLWVYYSSLIFFFGAELTEAYARRLGERVQPEPHAEPTHQPHHGEPAK